eukprot:tig00021254_g19716.t1
MTDYSTTIPQLFHYATDSCGTISATLADTSTSGHEYTATLVGDFKWLFTESGCVIRRRAMRQLASSAQDGLVHDAVNWYMPTYSLRYCPASGALLLPLDAFAPPSAAANSPLFRLFLPDGYSTNPFPMYAPALQKAWAVAYPPAPVVQAMVADPREDPLDPSSFARLHAIVRFPLFPAAAALGLSADEVALLSNASLRGDIPIAGAVRHLTLRLTWLVHPPVADGAAAAGDGGRGRADLSAADLLHNVSIRSDDAFIAQNAAPRYASSGHGALEGRFVEGARFGFYVVGDTVLRFRRPSAADRSAMGGAFAGEFRLTEAAGWAPSRDLWYSVGAATVQDGALFVAREVMSAPDGPGLPSDRLDADYTGRKVDFSAPFATAAHLVKLAGADDESVGRAVVLRGFTPGVRGVLAPEGAPPAGAPVGSGSRRLFFYTQKNPEVVAVTTDCPAGSRFALASGACVALPGGHASSRHGRAQALLKPYRKRLRGRRRLLTLEEADVCPPNTRGTFSANASSACSPCPQNTFGLLDGAGCTPCPSNSYTPALGWATECPVCPAGQFLSTITGQRLCLACPPSEFSAGGAVEGCTACPAGFVPTQAADSCKPCPTGTFQAAAKGPCQQCPLGTAALTEGTVAYPSDDGRECIPCAEGTYMKIRGGVCDVCPENSIAAERGQGSNCTACPPGTVSSADRRSCMSCPPAQYRSASLSSCTRCPEGTYAEGYGSAECTHCLPGFVSRPDRLGCSPCPAGTAPGANRTCAACPPRTYADAAATASCKACPSGYESSGDAHSCVACRAGWHLPFGASTCAECPANSISADAASTSCSVRPSLALDSFAGRSHGTFRNATGLTCTPCPWGTFSASPASVSCTPCGAGELCPLASSEPLEAVVDEDFEWAELEEAAEGGVARAARARRRLRESGAARRGLRSHARETESVLVNYGNLNCTVSEPSIKDETDANRVLADRFIILGSACLAGMLFVGIVFYVWIYLIPRHLAHMSMRERAGKVAWLHYFYRDDDTAPRTIRQLELPPRVGAFFTVLGATAVAVAVSFVVAQQATANFMVTQSLNPGVSPTLASIAGEFGVAVAFRGYPGPCVAPASGGAASASSADARVALTGIAATSAAAATAMTLQAAPGAGKTCTVRWSCTSCRVSSFESGGGTSVEVELAPPFSFPLSLAMAASVQFVVKVVDLSSSCVSIHLRRRQLPGGTSVNGSATPAAAERLFRGETAARLPVTLTAMHFAPAGDADGLARFKPGAMAVDNAAAEVGEATFEPLSRPQARPSSSQNRVAFRVDFAIAPNYVLVDRKTKNSVLDFLSGLYALGLAAFEVVAQLLALYVVLIRVLRRRKMVTVRETEEDFEGADQDEDASVTAFRGVGPGAFAPGESGKGAAGLQRRKSDGHLSVSSNPPAASPRRARDRRASTSDADRDAPAGHGQRPQRDELPAPPLLVHVAVSEEGTGAAPSVFQPPTMLSLQTDPDSELAGAAALPPCDTPTDVDRRTPAPAPQQGGSAPTRCPPARAEESHPGSGQHLSPPAPAAAAGHGRREPVEVVL